MPRSNAREISSFSQGEIDTLFRHARSFLKKRGLDLRLAPKFSDIGKILLVVPRKAGSAPYRNRLKRQLKSIFYEKKLFTKEFTWIVVARKEALDIPFSELRTILLEAHRLASSFQL